MCSALSLRGGPIAGCLEDYVNKTFVLPRTIVRNTLSLIMRGIPGDGSAQDLIDVPQLPQAKKRQVWSEAQEYE